MKPLPAEAFLPDTSCMIAAVCSWHEHHPAATEEFERRFARGERLVVAGPALLEAYAVLTRLPPPHRLSPETTALLLSANFIGEDLEIATLTAGEFPRLIASAAERNIMGGRLYDAAILACAESAHVDSLLTFNERHFRELHGGKLRVVVPGL